MFAASLPPSWSQWLKTQCDQCSDAGQSAARSFAPLGRMIQKICIEDQTAPLVSLVTFIILLSLNVWSIVCLLNVAQNCPLVAKWQMTLTAYIQSFLIAGWRADVGRGTSERENVCGNINSIISAPRLCTALFKQKGYLSKSKKSCAIFYHSQRTCQ